MANSVEGKMARGAVWMILFKWVERGLGLLSTLILVRVLSPADFGMVAMALSFIFMAELLSAFSFDVALIQNQSTTSDHYHSAWTANIMLGGIISFLMLTLAIPISDFYNQRALLPVICALSLGPLLGSLENIGIVAFRKDLNFRKEFIFQVCRKMLAFSVTVPLAFILHSYWALVAGTLASKLGGTLMSYWLHPFRPHLSFSEIKSLLRFSRWMLINNFVNFLKERSTDFVIGRFYGPAALGVYNVNNEFASLPSNEMGAPINRALLPGFAKLSNDKSAIAEAFVNAVGMVAVLAIPAGAGIFAVSHYLVPVVLGPKWIEGIPVMEVLSINSSILVFHGTAVTALVAIGNPLSATRINAFFVALMFAGMLLLTGKFGPLGAAYAVLGACILSTPVYIHQICKYASVKVLSLFRVIVRPLFASLLMIGFVRFALPKYIPGMNSGHAGLLLGLGVGLGALTYLITLPVLWMLMGRPEGAEWQVLSRIKSRLPTWVPLPNR